MNLAVFCSGYGSNFEAILDAVRKKRLAANVVLMVCDNPRAPALRRSAKYGVPVFLARPKLFRSREAYERLLVRVLKSQHVELIALAGFMRILSPYFIRAYRRRILNIHPALLPRFKGARAIRDAFEAGVRETGVTVHLVTEDVDAGPILMQRKVSLSKRDTLESLERKIHGVEHKLYPLAIKKWMRQMR